ncbi:RICIN domain-containing protein [Aquabacterium sp. A7-Y]|uniref:RICIN domain-containing protein n=1 Tax=Aquabacterium sp. A7-Y TaxID=1349605 RepID=UPI00223CEAB6|nr:RICIN domain-containing protein [Aquabacterium sp. A7-Y]MCW7536909.1 RICIN domain-containing protein [Aquabacterium sp. A7-Y]
MTQPPSRARRWTRPVAALALALAGGAAQAVTLDLLVLYDSHTANHFKGQPQTAIRSWVEQVNTIYANSQVDVQLRLVGTQQHDAPGSDMGDVLSQLRRNSSIAAKRDQVGADFVTQLHRHGQCGVAYMAVSASAAYSVVGPQCGPFTLAHELGHNMGLSHSRRQGDTGGARYAYALGHGVDRLFGTIMSYAHLFNAPRVGKFSNPRLTCSGVPCGVPEGQSQQADAAKAINNVRAELENFRPTKVGGPVEPPTSGTLPDGTYLLRARHSNKCADVKAASDENGANVHQWRCHGGDNQRWALRSLGNGYYEVKARHSGQCLDVDHSGTANGVNVQQWSCNGSTAQQWKPVSKGRGYFTLVSRVSGRVLDVAGGSQDNGANIYQWDATGANNQLWFLQRFD